MAERKSWKAWAVFDNAGRYTPAVFDTEKEARERRARWYSIEGSSFVVVPIRCTEITVDETKKKKGKVGRG